jgi:large subunit ribosomal protein L21
MFAIIKTGGKQYRVEEGLTLKVEKLTHAVGDSIELDDVLLVSGEDGIVIPAPGDAKVKATVIGQGKGPKVIVFKYKPKKGYHRKQGHRQLFTELRIESISLKGAAAKKSSRKQVKEEAAGE